MVKYYFSADNGRTEECENFKDKCWIALENPTDDECEDVSAFSGVPEDI